MIRLIRHTTVLSVALLAALALALLPSFALGGYALAHADTVPTLTLSASSAQAYSIITATVQGFAPDEVVEIYAATQFLGSINCDDEGTGSDTVGLPGRNITQGINALTATGESSGLVAQATIEVSPFFVLGVTGAAGTPLQGGPGAEIGAFGAGYQPGDVIQIYWGTADDGILEGSSTIDDQGNLNFAFDAPTDATPGNYTVTAVSTSNPYTFTATFPIISPSAAVPATIQGTQRIVFNYVGFQKGETLAVSWNANGGQTLANGIAFHDGQGGIVFTAPPAVGGTYTLTITGESSGLVLNYPVTVVPTITLNPNSTNVGNIITVKGSGYSANEAVNVYLQTPDGSVAAQTDATGSFTAQIQLPVTFDTQANYAVYATSEDGTDSAQAPFSFIAPWFYSSVYELSRSDGSDFLGGGGFLSNETINFYWDYQQSGQFLLGTTTTDSDGNFYLEATPPASVFSSNEIVTIAAIGQTSGFIKTTQIMVVTY